MAKALMLVSQSADAELRADVAAGRRPCPEYLRLEAQHDVELLDWSRLPRPVHQRTPASSLMHVAAAARVLRRFDVIFSDGEHLGIPLGLLLGLRRPAKAHLVLGHHITTRAKRRVFKLLRPQRGISRILLHSQRQVDMVESELGISRSKLAFVPYFADAAFWAPQHVAEDAKVVTAGREHRDYATLAAACDGMPERIVVAAGSFHSPRAPWRPPSHWPRNFELVPTLDRARLRELYARAMVVVVPVLPTDFQAGVTTLLEAMAMGKAVVVSATEGQRDVVEDGVTGVLVPPADPPALRAAIRRLLDDDRERARLGRNARRAVEMHFSLDVYATTLSGHLDELAAMGTSEGRTAAVPT
ncbi:MAG TPA: glycosyltransferase family 4 protein [Candidatus Dormibacteraeota bacterium]|nr:glycosyltransferase family 4 protein [Candidatus Dormibacteraeota bacterium]